MAAAEGAKGEASAKAKNWGPKAYNPSESFLKYYQQYLSSDDWTSFLATMKSPLPTTFRLAATDPRVSHVLETLKQQHITAMKDVKLDGKNIEPCKPIPWYPDELGWQFDFPKIALRKDPTLKLFHEFLKAETAAGLLSRQEAVSMVPVLMLGASPEHRILDACAAPGMKTLQLLDQLHHQALMPTGFVMANDADGRRCSMLAHHSKRMRSPAYIITHHDATTLPAPPAGDSGEAGFDRILCDVPCSSDGTMRKAPHLWPKWKPATGLGMHCLQLRIVLHCSSLLRVGGSMCYSTCSLNPLENEAVVAELLRQANGSLRVVDVSERLPELVRAAGLSDWTVHADEDSQYLSLEEARAAGRSQVTPSMFPPSQEEREWMHLERCVRIWPQLQNTGGFFVCILEKVPSDGAPKGRKRKAEEASLAPEVLANVPKDELVQASDLPHNSSEEPYMQLTGGALDAGEGIVRSIKEFFQLKSSFPESQLFARSQECNRISMVSESIRDILAVQPCEVKAISSGCQVFGRCNFNRTKRACDFRILQDGVHLVGPHMGARVVHLSDPDEFCELAMHKAVGIANMRNQETRSQLEAMEVGSVVISCKSAAGRQLWAVGEKTAVTLNLFVTKEELQQLVAVVSPGTEFVWKGGTRQQVEGAEAECVDQE